MASTGVATTGLSHNAFLNVGTRVLTQCGASKATTGIEPV